MIPDIFDFEGLDASGKATQVQMFQQSLKRKGYDCKVFRFPLYETRTGKLLKDFLLGKWEIETLRAKALLFAMDRFEASPEIESYLKKGYKVVYDRFSMSNRAYQGALLKGKERKDFIEWCWKIEEPLPNPEITFFMNVTPDASTLLCDLRVGLTGVPKDRNESNASYLKNVYEVYLNLLKIEENVHSVQCITNDFLRKPKTLEQLSEEFKTLDDRIAYVVRPVQEIHEDVIRQVPGLN